jgi:hypothetical protein
MSQEEPVPRSRRLLPFIILSTGFSLLLTIYSQTGVLYGDESFHLLAARFLSEGKRPYLDFFYQHTPFYIGIAAAWIKIFGNSWRAVHLLSALFSSGCLILAAHFTYARIPEPRWKLPCSMAASCFFAMNPTVVECATTGHPYAATLFFLMAAVVLAVRTMSNTRLHVFLTGLCAGASAAASLLAAPLVPILMVWLLRFRKAGGVPATCLFFCLGAAIPFLPLAWYGLMAPKRVFADIFQYSVLLRSQGFWAGQSLWRQDFWALATWLRSPWAAILFLLSAAGFVFLRNEGSEAFKREECSLIFWLVTGLAVYLLIPQPTFTQYFILLFPLLSILASVTVFAIGTNIARGSVPVWLLLAVLVMYSFEGSQLFYYQTVKSESTWKTIEVVSREVDRITPGDAPILASEEVYFTTTRSYAVPGGAENYYATRLTGDAARAIGIVPGNEIDAKIAQGAFATIALKDYDPRAMLVHNSSHYAQDLARGRYVVWIHR